MRQHELDHILSREKEIVPSAKFTASVMDAIRSEAAAPPPISFPWVRALPGLIVGAIALLWIVVHNPESAGVAASDSICLSFSVVARSTYAHPEVSRVSRNWLGPAVADSHIRVLGTDTVCCWKAHISRFRLTLLRSISATVTNFARTGSNNEEWSTSETLSQQGDCSVPLVGLQRLVSLGRVGKDAEGLRIPRWRISSRRFRGSSTRRRLSGSPR